MKYVVSSELMDKFIANELVLKNNINYYKEEEEKINNQRELALRIKELENKIDNDDREGKPNQADKKNL